jgi:Rrf2 family protein
MRVPQQVDYALRVLVLLAGVPDGERTAAGAFAERLLLPRRFVEQQVTALTRAGIVSAKRGATGGIALARPADEISVRDVVLGVKGDVLDVPRQRDSATAEFWTRAAAVLEEYLDQTSVEDLAQRQREIDAQREPMYFI